MIAVADSAETKDQWVSGCNAVIKGQVYVVTNAQPSLAPEPEPEPEPPMEPGRTTTVSFAQGPPQEAMEYNDGGREATALEYSEGVRDAQVMRGASALFNTTGTLNLSVMAPAVEAPPSADGVLDLSRIGMAPAPAPTLARDYEVAADDGLGPSPRAADASIFGQPVESVRAPKAKSHAFLPAVIDELTSWLRTNGTATVGLLRRPMHEDAADQDLELLSSQLDEGNSGAGVFEGMRAHTVAGVLKNWLRQIPQPLLTEYLFNDWVAAANAESQTQCVEAVTTAVAKLPLANFEILKHLVEFLVAHSAASNTSLQDIATDVTPLLLWSDYDDLPLSSAEDTHRAEMVGLLLERSEKTFRDRADHPVRLPPSWSQETATQYVEKVKQKYGRESSLADEFVAAMEQYSRDTLSGEGLAEKLLQIFSVHDGEGFACELVAVFLPQHVQAVPWIQSRLQQWNRDADTDDEMDDPYAAPVVTRADPDQFEAKLKASGMEAQFYQMLQEEYAAAKIQALARGVLARRKGAAEMKALEPEDYYASLTIVGVKSKPMTYYMEKSVIVIGRKTKKATDVDVDVSFAGESKQSKVSRQHASIRYDAGADQFTLRCLAQRNKQHIVLNQLVRTSHDTDKLIGEDDTADEIRVGNATIYFSRKGAHPAVIGGLKKLAAKGGESAAAAIRNGLLGVTGGAVPTSSPAFTTSTDDGSVARKRPDNPILANADPADGHQEGCELGVVPFLAILEADDGSAYYMDRGMFLLGRDSVSARGQGGPHCLLTHCGPAVSRIQLAISFKMDEVHSDYFAIENLGKKSIQIDGRALKRGDPAIELLSRTHITIGSTSLFFKHMDDQHMDVAVKVIQRTMRNKWTSRQLENIAARERIAEDRQYRWWAKNLSKATATAAARAEELDTELEESALQMERDVLAETERVGKQLTSQLKLLQGKRLVLRDTTGDSDPASAVAAKVELDAFGETYIYNNATGELTHIGEQAARMIQPIFRGYLVRRGRGYSSRMVEIKEQFDEMDMEIQPFDAPFIREMLVLRETEDDNIEESVTFHIAEQAVMQQVIQEAWHSHAETLYEMRAQRAWFLDGGPEPSNVCQVAWEGWKAAKVECTAAVTSADIGHARAAGFVVPVAVPKFKRQAMARQAQRQASEAQRRRQLDPEHLEETQRLKVEEDLRDQLQHQWSQVKATDANASRGRSMGGTGTSEGTAWASRVVPVPQSSTASAVDADLPPDKRTDPVGYNQWMRAQQQKSQMSALRTQVTPQPQPEPEPELKSDPEPEPVATPEAHFSRRSPMQPRQQQTEVGSPSALARGRSDPPRPGRKAADSSALARRREDARPPQPVASSPQPTPSIVQMQARVATPPDRFSDPDGHQAFLVATQQSVQRSQQSGGGGGGGGMSAASQYAAAGAALLAANSSVASPSAELSRGRSDPPRKGASANLSLSPRIGIDADDDDYDDDTASDDEDVEALLAQQRMEEVNARERQKLVDEAAERAQAAAAEAAYAAAVKAASHEADEAKARAAVAEAVAAAVEKAAPAPAPVAPPPAPETEDDDDSDSDQDDSDIAAQIAQLERLHAAGHIEASELAEFKAALLEAPAPGGGADSDDDEDTYHEEEEDYAAAAARHPEEEARPGSRQAAAVAAPAPRWRPEPAAVPSARERPAGRPEQQRPPMRRLLPAVVSVVSSSQRGGTGAGYSWS